MHGADRRAPDCMPFEDKSELKVIADDFEEFKLFLNNSYNANEFYVRDIVGLATYVIDEFSLRRHIDFVPGIVNEMWDIMGESGKAVHKSILWIIEAIKTSYQKAVAFINGILKDGKRSQKHTIKAGVLQGSKLAPHLYNIYVADIPTHDQVQNDSGIADNLTNLPIPSSFQPKPDLHA
uniref:Uncharacterized protein n=1 Tax=Timema genevievae TaxID=629358 RepID=A0A7R9K405_TIMGE|nr:unnamed protein product [Timema genevievae]